MAYSKSVYSYLAPRDNNEAKIPVVILLDVSGSMDAHGNIHAMSREINRVIKMFKENELTRNMVEIKIILFSHETKVLVDWCSPDEVPEISLSAEGGTDLGKAIITTYEETKAHAREKVDMGQKVFLPYVFLITDCEVSADNITNAAKLIREKTEQRKICLWALGVKGYNTEMLAKLTGGVRIFELKDENSNDYSEFFEKVIAGVIGSVSKRVSLASRGISTNSFDWADDPRKNSKSSLRVPSMKEEWLMI